ncbi:MAG: sterol desaturase family protein [Sphingomonas bacterium]
MASPDPRTQRIRLFENEQLEKLTVISPPVFGLIWGVALPLIVWTGWGSADVLPAVGLIFTGLVAWSLFEYAMHRYLFHWELDWRPVRWLVFLIHGNHHDSPNDEMRNLMPPIVSLPIAGLIWWGCTEAMGPAGTWLFLGFIAGYVCYDLVHFACHQWPMRGRLALMLKRHHMRHHYVNEDRNYAITAIFWDSVFRTRITSLKD